MEKHHEITQGECIDSIANETGFFWKTLWNHPQNKGLKKKRKDPFILLPGDAVFIPDLRVKKLDRSTDQKHIFKKKGVPSLFKIQIKNNGIPRKNTSYRLIIDNEIIHEGKLDGEGRLHVAIHPSARRGKLYLLDNEIDKEKTPSTFDEICDWMMAQNEAGIGQDVVSLFFGALDPIDTLSGLQKRLENLGYSPGLSGKLDEDTRAAIFEFQKVYHLTPSGEPDGPTRSKLTDVYGS